VQALAFWKAVTMDRAGVLERVVEQLRAGGVRFCVVGGQAVNAYVEPVVSLDLDVVVATDRLDAVAAAATERGMRAESFAHSVNLSLAGSDLRLQLQTDPRYQAFIPRAAPRSVLGYTLRVAAIEDVLQGKLWAFQDDSRRASKRQKDLADVARLVEARPELAAALPAAVRDRIL
jgi:hypothetical protein